METARAVIAAEPWTDWRGFMEQWRQREPLIRLQKSLFYQRYATAVLLAHRVGVFDALAAGPATSAELANRCQLRNRSADALLRILHAQGYVDRDADRYELSDFAQLYLTQGGAHSLSDTLDFVAVQTESFADTAAGLRTGHAPAKLDIHSDEAAYPQFVRAVNEYLKWATPELLAQIELPEISDCIVGSMGVSFSAALLKRAPKARVTYGCLAHLVPEIGPLRQLYGVPAERVTGESVHAGDPSTDSWGGDAFDLVFLTKKMIVDPEDRIGERFARKAFQVLRKGGVAVLWETLHTEQNRTPIGRAMEAVFDLGASPDGLVHTEASLHQLLTDIGYGDVHTVACLGGQTTFTVAYAP